ncbi:hypothetical protein [Pseudomonas purpurea]|uniref:hypothetical protein n=1 Tax=Pseudomonas purpurea TaxID=3136737 RepID=UPI003265B070
MTILWPLFVSRRKYRYFAQLDANQCCLAFRHCQRVPTGKGWVEIQEIRLNWLHRPLPDSARVRGRAPRSWLQQLLPS